MTDNVIPLNNLTRLGIPVDRVLDADKDAYLRTVYIFGHEGREEYFYLSTSDGGEVAYVYWKK